MAAPDAVSSNSAVVSSALSKQHVITDGDQVIFKKGKFLKVMEARKNRVVWVENVKFKLDEMFGHPFGTHFEVKQGKLFVKKQCTAVLSAPIADSFGGDNRNLLARDANQKLRQEDVKNLQKSGVCGDALLGQLIENSSTFAQKTEFSQEKWIKKKQAKHMASITVLRATTRLLAQMYYDRDPLRICNMRPDSLAQLLTCSGVRSNSRPLVVETCQGLVVGAVLERLGGHGYAVQFFVGDNPMKQRCALEDYAFSKDTLKSNLKLYPLNEVNSLRPSPSGTGAVGGQPASTTGGVAEVVPATIAAENGNADCSHSDDLEEPPGKRLRLEDQVVEERPVSCIPMGVQSSAMIVCQDERNDLSGHHNVKDRAVANDTAATVADHVSDGADNLLSIADAFLPKPAAASGAAIALPSLPLWHAERVSTRAVLKQGNFDTLIVATKFHPTPIVLGLIDLVAPSRPIAIYHQHLEPLMDCYAALRERGGLVCLRLSETWLREQQVLPQRTHPLVLMSGTGGYLLTGTTVALNNSVASGTTASTASS